MKLKSTIVLLAFISVAFTQMSMRMEVRHEKELFPGEAKLRGCRINIPLTNSQKDEPYCIKAERDNKGKPIVLVRYDKKAQAATFYRYYLVSNDLNGKKIFYLQSVEDYNNKIQKAVVYTYKPATDRFYSSECFDETLSSNEELQGKLAEGTYDGKKYGF